MFYYICLECGLKFEEPAKWSEDRGEYWGVPCREEMCGCPSCYGAFDVIEDDEDDNNVE